MTQILTLREVSVSTSSQAAAAALFRFEDEVLNYGSGAAVVVDAPVLDPEWALAHAYAGALQLFRSTRPGVEAATVLLAQARKLESGNFRERLMIAALSNWVNGNAADAIVQLGHLIERFPADLFAVRLRQHLQFSRGDAVGMLRTIETVFEAHRHDARAWSMRAFALDQCGRHHEAENAARTALSIAPDPWAHHGMAHALHATGRFAEGRAWMHLHASDWAACTSFLFTHNWWHAALFDLALGRNDDALDLFDRHVWGVRKDYAQDQINAVSLLARLEVAGVDAGDRWADIASFIRPRCTDAVDPFLDLHYAYALARAGDNEGVGELIEQLRQHTGDDTRRFIVATAAQGLAAFAFGRRPQAARLLGAVRNSLYLLGGSTVQRALFDTLLDSARERPDEELQGIAA